MGVKFGEIERGEMDWTQSPYSHVQSSTQHNNLDLSILVHPAQREVANKETTVNGGL